MKKGPKNTEKPSTKTKQASAPKSIKDDSELSVADLDRAAGGNLPARPAEEAKK